MAGLPALVLPCGFVKNGTAGLPVGFQMIGAAFDEVELISSYYFFHVHVLDIMDLIDMAGE